MTYSPPPPTPPLAPTRSLSIAQALESRKAREAELVEREEASLRACAAAETAAAEADARVSESSRAAAAATERATQLEALVGVLKGDRDAVVARSLASMAAHDAAISEKNSELALLAPARDRALAALRDAESELARLRGVCVGQEAELNARVAHEGAMRVELERVSAEIAGLREACGDRALLQTRVAHLLVDCGRLLALLRTTPAYAAHANVLFPLARSRAMQSAWAAAGGGDAGDEAAAAAGERAASSLRSTYLGSGLGNFRDSVGAPALGTVAPEMMARAAFPSVPPLSADKRWDALPALEDGYGAVADSLAVEEAEGGKGAGDESDSWVPSDAAALASAFRARHLGHVDSETVRAFLVALQVVWRRRAAELVASARAELLRKLRDAKKALRDRTPYREVMQAATIVRVNSELQNARARAGQSGGTAGGPVVAVPISDIDAHGVAFGRTTAIVGGATLGGPPGLGAGGAGVVAGYLRSARRGYEPDVPEDAEERPLGEEEAAGERARELRERAAGRSAPLPATLIRVPGSGARRLDAVEAGRLLASALEAVDDLNARNTTLLEENKALKAREALRASEDALLRGGGGPSAGAAAAATRTHARGAPVRAVSTPTAALSATKTTPLFQPPQTHGAGSASLAGFAATAYGIVGAGAGRALLPPPAYLEATGGRAAAAAAAAPAWGYVLTASGDVVAGAEPAVGSSGAFNPPFSRSSQAGAGPLRAFGSALAGSARAPPTAPSYSAHTSVSATPSARVDERLVSSATAPPVRSRRLSVGEAVRAAVGAAQVTVAEAAAHAAV